MVATITLKWKLDADRLTEYHRRVKLWRRYPSERQLLVGFLIAYYGYRLRWKHAYENAVALANVGSLIFFIIYVAVLIVKSL